VTAIAFVAFGVLMLRAVIREFRSTAPARVPAAA
jgi:hypothetical protein